MERQETALAIGRVIGRYPLLGYEGFYQWPRRSGPLDEWRACQQSRMLTANGVDQFLTVLAALDGIEFNRKAAPGTGVGSYGFKHFAEQWGAANGMSPYVADGMGICACIHAGVPIGLEPGRINCTLGLNRRSYHKKASP